MSSPFQRDELVVPEAVEDDIEAELGDEGGLRPRTLDDFVGQRELKEHLQIVLEAARMRGQAADHLLFAGPPGLGKTTLSGIIAVEMGVGLHVTSGPALERPGDLAAILTRLADDDVLFIDEIHRLSRAVEEVLYPAMEDFVVDIVLGKGPAARSLRLDLPPFTLVGATTRTGLITGPLRDRFGLVARLDYYTALDLEAIVVRAAGILGEQKISHFVSVLAQDLKQNRGKSIVAVGPAQPADVHAIAARINATLGNQNATVLYTAVEDRPRHVDDLKSLTDAMNAGKVKGLLILGGNPVYDAPADLDFAAALGVFEVDEQQLERVRGKHL